MFKMRVSLVCNVAITLSPVPAYRAMQKWKRKSLCTEDAVLTVHLLAVDCRHAVRTILCEPINSTLLLKFELVMT